MESETNIITKLNVIIINEDTTIYWNNDTRIWDESIANWDEDIN